MTKASVRNEIGKIFSTIVTLEPGEGLVFSPSAMLEMVPNNDIDPPMIAKKLGMGYIKMRVRKRLTTDGGKSTMAQ